MTAYDNHRPQDAPTTILATADGKTVLHRYRVEAVIYAPTRIDALLRLEHGAVYLDAARLLRDEDEPGYKASGRIFDGLSAPRRPAGWPEDDLLGQSVCAEHVPDYAKGQQVPSDAPCVVCGEPSVMVLPKIIPDDDDEYARIRHPEDGPDARFIARHANGKMRSDGEWPK